ncbi:MAG: hypothetical protein LBT11_05605 [Treponema sp.]|jgi:hypothetical protein|nr:hypothetical protein [Treponema sp.]
MKSKLFLAIVLIPLFSLSLIASLAACSGRISGALASDGQAEFSLEISLVKSLVPIMGNALNAREIAQSFAAVPGVESVNLRELSSSSLEGSVKLSRIDHFLALPVSASGKQFIRYEEAGQGLSRLVISLDRSISPQIAALLSEDVRDYLSALIPPAVTGEDLSKEEYLALISAIYSRTMMNEIRDARISLSIDFPRPIQRIQGGAYRDRRAEFTLSLLDLLVLEQPITWEVSW